MTPPPQPPAVVQAPLDAASMSKRTSTVPLAPGPETRTSLAGIPAQLDTAADTSGIPSEPSERFVCAPVVRVVALGEAPVSQNQRMRQGVREPHVPGSRPPKLTHVGT